MADAAGRIETVVRDGLTFDVIDQGPIDGEPIVLLHGFPERATSWRYVAPILNTAGFRTLALDQRGYAPGARPKRRRDYVQDELLSDVKTLIDAAGGSAHVVGHDWGAANAWWTAMEHPEAVRTLTAVSVAHPAAFVDSFLRSAQGLKSWYMLAFQLPFLPEAVGSRWLDRFMRMGGMTAEEAAHVRTGVIEAGALPTALNWYRALPFNDFKRARTKVTVPTTLVWSTDDVALGRWAPEHTEKWVDAPFELVVLQGVSHWIPGQAPDALADAILERVRGEAI